MTLTAELYFSFRSPYSYLSVGRYWAMTEEFDLNIALRPVYPLAIRQPDFFERNHPNWLGYTMRDMLRVAQFHDIPFGAPRPDPIVQDMATRQIAEEQPFIRRVTRMGQAAARRGAGLVFAAEAGRMIWGGQENWHEGGHLERAIEAAVLGVEEIIAEVEVEGQALDAEIASNQHALEKAGHWGVPTLVFDGEPFFGQDRIEMAMWRMDQKGLQKR
jgi:2-hydroxychromene-2-carboxylate isomerase